MACRVISTSTPSRGDRRSLTTDAEPPPVDGASARGRVPAEGHPSEGHDLARSDRGRDLPLSNRSAFENGYGYAVPREDPRTITSMRRLPAGVVASGRLRCCSGRPGAFIARMLQFATKRRAVVDASRSREYHWAQGQPGFPPTPLGCLDGSLVSESGLPSRSPCAGSRRLVNDSDTGGHRDW
jgi:hypothetical protein